jgi:hypothetical protein
MNNREDDFEWSAVIARCFAYLCLKNSKHADSSLLEQAAFLERMGLPAGDRADVLGTSRDSLRALGHQARKRKGGKKNAKAKRR